MENIYRRLGARTIVNAKGPSTRRSGASTALGTARA